jgi:hypothetical protein
VYDRLGNPAEYGDNISRIGNLGTDANDPVQTVEAEQPVFRDVGNAADYGDGYLYLDGVGSYASIPDPIGALTDFTLQVDGLSPETVRPPADGTLMSQYGGSSAAGSFLLIVNASGSVYLYLFAGTDETHYGTAVPTDTVGIRVTRVGTLITYWVDTGSGYVSHDTDTSAGTVLNNPSQPFEIGTFNSGNSSPLLGTISRAQVWDNGAQTGDPVVDADFRNATHKLTDTDTFIANSGQQITINGGATVYNPPVASTLRTTTDLGFLDLDGVGGSYASIPDPIGALGDFTLQADGLSPETVRPAQPHHTLMSQYSGSLGSFILRVHTSGLVFLYLYGGTDETHQSIAVPTDTVGIRVTRVGTLITYWVDTGSGYVSHDTDTSVGSVLNNPTSALEIGSYNVASSPLTGTISRAQIWDNGTAAGTAVFDADFRNRTTTLTDTDTFVATSGQTVTINGGATARRKITLNPDGYLYCDGVAGSYASIPDAANLNGITDFVMEAKDVYMSDWATGNETFFSKFGSGGNAFTLRRSALNINIYAFYGGVGTFSYFPHGLTGAATASVRLTRVGTSLSAELDTGSGYVAIGTPQTVPADAIDTTTNPIEIGSRINGTNNLLTGTISRAQIWSDSTQTTKVLDADFRDNPTTLGDTDTLAAATGQTITINGGATAYAARVKAPKAEAGYLHLPGVFGNYASVPDAAALDVTGDLTLEVDATIPDITPATEQTLLGKYNTLTANRSYQLILKTDSSIRFIVSPDGLYDGSNSVSSSNSLGSLGISDGQRVTIKSTWRQSDGRVQLFVKPNGGSYQQLGADLTANAGSIHSGTADVNVGAVDGGTFGVYTGPIHRAIIKDGIDGTPVLDVDFDRAKANATSFAAKTGQTVTINQSTLTGDRAKIVKSSEIFYDGAGDEFDFTLSSTFSGKMIVASTQGILVADMSRGAGTHQIEHRGVGDVTSLTHPGGGLEQKGVMLLSPSSSPAALTSAFVARGAVKSFAARTEFGKAFRYMGLTSFPTIDISNGVNCYAAFEAYQGTSFPPLNFASATSLATAWYGSTSLTSVPAIQAPVCTNFGSAWKSNTALATIDPAANFGESATGVNFNNAFESSGLTALPAGLDMSKGDEFKATFWGCSSLATIGDGVKLGTASIGVAFSQTFQNSGLTELPAGLDMSKGFTFASAFQDCASLTTIGSGVLLGTAYATATVNFTYAFLNCAALTALPAGLDMSQGRYFISAFNGCTSLTTIGTGVLLGTASSNVNFTSAFRTSGLTALPAGLDLSQGNTFDGAFYGCSSLATIGTGVKLGTASSNVEFSYAFYNTGLTELPAGLDLSQGDSFYATFLSCGSLETIGSGVLLGTASNSVDFTNAFRSCTNLVTLPANLNLSKGDDFQYVFRDCSSLVTFPAGAFDTMGTPATGCFFYAWKGCSSLSGASVDAILDSIDTSGQSGPTITTNEADITIDYDTGTTAPAYTTLASLQGKGWVIIVNGTTL